MPSKPRRAQVAMGAQFAVQQWPHIVKALKLQSDDLAPFREWLQAQVDTESLAKLKDAYGADVKPAPHGFKTNAHVKELYRDLKWRIVNRILDEVGYKGRRLFLLNFYDAEEAIMPKDEAKVAENPAKEDTRKHDYVETAHGEFRKDSVLHIIYKSLARRGGSTKAEIAEALEAQYPTKDGPGWDEKSTINCQIDRMGTERGFKLARNEKGKYGIEPGKAVEGQHKGEAMEFSGLTGWDTTRVMTPEQKAKKEAAEKVKLAKAAEKEKEKAAKTAAKEKLKAAQDKAKKEAAEKEAVEQAKRDAAEQKKKEAAAKLK